MNKKPLIVLCTAGLLFSTASVIMHGPVTVQAATHSATKYPGKMVQLGSTGSAVKELQTQLNKLGYHCGKVDGVFGSATKAAVKKFQKAKKMTVDGQVGPQTWAKLFASTPAKNPNSSKASSSKPKTSTASVKYPGKMVQLGSTGSAVKEVQTQLNKLGYNCGKVDGVFGSTTKSAVKKFQKAKKMTVDGQVGPQTWAKLFASTPAKSPSSSKNSSKTKSSNTSGSGATKPASSKPKTSTASSGNKSSTTSATSSSKPASSKPKPAFPGKSVQLNSTGEVVKEVQNQLNLLGYNCGKADGDFGLQTESAVKGFQKAKNLTADGVIGLQTWNALFGITGGYTNVDLRTDAPKQVTASTINSFLRTNQYNGAIGSPLTGLGESFIEAQNIYAVNATYLVAHAILESANGTSNIALAKNNLFGYGAYNRNAGADAGIFPSDDYAIRFQAWEVRYHYLTPGADNYGGTPTLTGMSKNYATDPSWGNSIGDIMSEISTASDTDLSDYTQYTGSNSIVAPSTSAEPVYYMNGATGVVQSREDSTKSQSSSESYSAYGGVPYYSTVADGERNMFTNALQTGSSGRGVMILQEYLNSVDKAGLTEDGNFGNQTKNAVIAFQNKHHLSNPNGIWTSAMWKTYIQGDKTYQTPTLTAGTTVNIDEIAQGMVGGYVTPWYHIQGKGWVDSAYIQCKNVYMLSVSKPSATNSAIAVYSSNTGARQIATLHNGDFITTNRTATSNGMYEIQFAAQTSGSSFGNRPVATMLTGYIRASQAGLTKEA